MSTAKAEPVDMEATAQAPEGKSRRGFLRAAFGVLTAAIAAAVGGPILTAFFSPARRRTVQSGGSASFGPLDKLPIGKPQRHDVMGSGTDAWDRSDVAAIGAVWLVRRDATHVDAYSATCPHLGCPVGFDPGPNRFTCPCHESSFALADGSCLGGPAPRGLDPLPVDVKDGEVFVTYQKFIQGIASRRPA